MKDNTTSSAFADRIFIHWLALVPPGMGTTCAYVLDLSHQRGVSFPVGNVEARGDTARGVIPGITRKETAKGRAEKHSGNGRNY
jgi:hypothetical protein